jgi:hypothetical protein
MRTRDIKLMSGTLRLRESSETVTIGRAASPPLLAMYHQAVRYESRAREVTANMC